MNNKHNIKSYYENKKYKKSHTYFCGNCGKEGHIYKTCREPIISTGIILVDIVGNRTDKIIQKLIELYCENNSEPLIEINAKDINYKNENMLKIFCQYKNRIRFLMVRRKHSLGYIEFVRGRYNIQNIDGITFLFKQMMKEEIEKIKNYTFKELWMDLWSTDTIIYKLEYEKANHKYNRLNEDARLNINFFVNKIPLVLTHPEWGFPKGRRNCQESDLRCAHREFLEETGYHNDEFELCSNICPIVELLRGTNSKKYKHIYYLAFNKTDNEPIIHPDNIHQKREIGDIGWFTYEQVMMLLRTYHQDRRRIVMKIYAYIINNIMDIMEQDCE